MLFSKPAKTDKNCTELIKDYKGGVAESSSSKNKGGKTKYKPHVSKELYDANKSKDRDKDGIACER
ncbi:excalibur calcium-binding domain-containing protein [Bacillus sp. JJ1773]|uniref:excalibur calcium-binding domain-containing protein n=1 Tax=Bacillus sp. JJ1773 TaxID=3122965 RepID=UPI002FFFFCB4